MKIRFVWIGRTKESGFAQSLDLYHRRLSHYARTEITELKEVRGGGKLSPDILKSKEAEVLLRAVEPQDYLVLLDERGDQLTSVGLSQFLETRMNQGTSRMVLLIGGAYGVDASVRERANRTWSLSKLTMTHDMARLFSMEQIYRGFTILRGEKYHNA